jgi:hypothetical protein
MDLDLHPIKTPLIVVVWFCLWSIFEKALPTIIGNSTRVHIITHVLILCIVCAFLVFYPDATIMS